MPKPAFHLITGPTGDYYYFQKEITTRIDRGDGFSYDFIYFLPVKRAVRYFAEQLTTHSSHAVLAAPPVYTFYDFMVQLYKSLPGARKVISQAMRLFLIEETLTNNVDQLLFFNTTSAGRRGLVSKVDALINELREYGYDATQLMESAEALERQRYHDFSILLEAFQQSLGEHLIDEAGAIQSVIEQLDPDGRLWRKRYPNVDVIYMSGYGLFSKPMTRFFELLRNVVNIRIKLDYLDEGQQPRVFEHVHKAYNDLKSLKPVELQSGPARPWERDLFKRQHLSARLSLEKKVQIQPCQNRTQEVAFIANYVKRLHLQEGIPLHDIGITFPSLEQYAPLIHEIFPKYGLPDTGLPYNLSTGFQLSQSPLIRSFLLVLEIPLSNFEVSKLLQLLSSPFLRPDQQAALNVGIVRQIARSLRLTHFTKNWQQDFDRLLGFLEEQIATAREEDTFGLAQMQAQLARFAAARKPLATLLESLATLQKRQSGNDFRNQFLAILEQLGFLGWYRTANPHLSTTEQEKEFRGFNRFIVLLDQFSWIVTNLHGNQKRTLKDFHNYLSLLVSQATYNLREWSNFGLQIMPRLEILAVEPRVLIFGGMIEGEFPRPYTRDVFFSDDEREKMGLAATEDLLAQDRYLFYQVLRSGTERLVFTYPRFQKEATLVPSNFLNVLEDQTDVSWRIRMPSSLFLQNQSELLERVAMGIPPGVTPSDRIKLSRWRQIHQHDEEKQRTVRRWLEKTAIEHRKRGRAFTVHEGILDNDPKIVAALRDHFNERPFSITRLENFAFCPIRFFMEYLLRLAEEQDIETGLTALERGELVHRTLFRFFVKLRKQERHRTPWLGGNLLRKIAEEEFDKLPFRGLLFELEKEVYFGSERHAGLWEIFLREEENKIDAWGFYPAYFEVAFGRAGRKSDQDPNIKDIGAITLARGDTAFQVTGKVDRIDLNDRGEALLLDYKTGRHFAKTRDVLQGTDLQLPVYAMVVNRLLRDHHSEGNITPVMTAIYQVRDPENCQRHPLMADSDIVNIGNRGHAALPNRHIRDEKGHELRFNDLMSRTERLLFDYVEKIRQGQFRHTRFPDDHGCKHYCEFRRMCRKDVRKLLDDAETQ